MGELEQGVWGLQGLGTAGSVTAGSGDCRVWGLQGLGTAGAAGSGDCRVWGLQGLGPGDCRVWGLQGLGTAGSGDCSGSFKTRSRFRARHNCSL